MSNQIAKIVNVIDDAMKDGVKGIVVTVTNNHYSSTSMAILDGVYYTDKSVTLSCKDCSEYSFTQLDDVEVECDDDCGELTLSIDDMTVSLQMIYENAA